MTSERNPSTSALTLSCEIPFGLDWKNFLVTDTMFAPGLETASNGEVTGGFIAAAIRSFIASKGKGAVTCTDQIEIPALALSGCAIAHGLQLLPSMFHWLFGISLYGFHAICRVHLVYGRNVIRTSYSCLLDRLRQLQPPR